MNAPDDDELGYFGEIIAERLAEGWADDEVLDELDRRWDHGSRGERHGPMPVRMRHLAQARLAELRGDEPIPRPMTPLAREKIPTIPAAAGSLRRSTGRVSKVALARRLEIDPGTLREWIAAGWTPWPPD